MLCSQGWVQISMMAFEEVSKDTPHFQRVCLPYAESNGFEKEAGDNAKLCFISYVLALAVLPCLFAVLTKICGM